MPGTFETFGRYLDRCESPIEQRFLAALLFSGAFTFRPVTARGPAEIAEDADGVCLGQQVPVGGYRVDFAMKRAGTRGRIAIEIDGRSFHSSPQEVERDKVRDRVLLACGWTTIRFAAREVIRDAVGCAQQARSIALKISTGEPMPRLARAIAPGGQVLLAAGGAPLLSRATARTG